MSKFNAGDGVISLRVDTSGLDQAASRVRSSMSNVSSGASSGLAGVVGAIGSVTAGLATASLAVMQAGQIAVNVLSKVAHTLFEIGSSSVEAFAESEKEFFKLEAVLKATGNTAGFSAEQLSKVASNIQATTMFSDESAMAMFSILSQFGNIRGDAFSKASESILNLATVFDKDLKGAAVAVGKALQNPIEGLDGLSRYGIRFSDVQKEMIRSLIDAGKFTEAQALVQQRLNSMQEVAARVGDSTAGALEKMKNVFDDLKETIGAQLAPAIQAMAKWMVKNSELLKAVVNELTKSVMKCVNQLGEFIMRIVGANSLEGVLMKAANAVDYFKLVLLKMWKTFATIIAAGSIPFTEAWFNNMKRVGDAMKSIEQTTKDIEERNKRIKDIVDPDIFTRAKNRIKDFFQSILDFVASKFGVKAFEMPKSSGPKSNFSTQFLSSALDAFKTTQTSVFNVDPAVAEQKVTNQRLAENKDVLKQIKDILTDISKSPRGVLMA
jgi:hypothetical protein